MLPFKITRFKSYLNHNLGKEKTTTKHINNNITSNRMET